MKQTNTQTSRGTQKIKRSGSRTATRGRGTGHRASPFSDRSDEGSRHDRNAEAIETTDENFSADTWGLDVANDDDRAQGVVREQPGGDWDDERDVQDQGGDHGGGLPAAGGDLAAFWPQQSRG